MNKKKIAILLSMFYEEYIRKQVILNPLTAEGVSDFFQTRVAAVRFVPLVNRGELRGIPASENYDVLIRINQTKYEQEVTLIHEVIHGIFDITSTAAERMMLKISDAVHDSIEEIIDKEAIRFVSEQPAFVDALHFSYRLQYGVAKRRFSQLSLF